MKLEDLIKAYEKKRQLHKEKAYLHISEIFEEAREKHRQDYLSSSKAKKKKESGGLPDAEQSWKSFKGHSFEKLMLHIIKRELDSLNLKCVLGDELNKNMLTAELGRVYRSLLVRYGEYAILPDVDLVIYEPSTCKVIGVVSCKITLRERIAQTAYWKLKLSSDPLTMDIKGYFITADEDGDLMKGLDSPSRNRIIVEHELDGTYVLRDVEESAKVKTFPKFIEDLKRLIYGKHG